MKLTFIEKILSFLSVTFRAIKNALKDGQEIVDKIKAVTDSPVVKAIVKASPTKWDDAAIAALVAFATIMGWADKLISDFEGDPDAKVVVYTALAAKAAVIEAEQQGHKLTMQQAMAAIPVSYDPTIVNV
jgi:hypothetical protein